MFTFFYFNLKLSGKHGHRRSVLIAVFAIIFLAVPFVDATIWVLLNVVGFDLTNRSIYLFIGPITTIFAVLVIIAPIATLWNRLFRKLDQEALRAQNAQTEAERLLAQRTDFVAYVSHEIRNPLNAIMGIADTFDQSKLEEDARNKLKIIQNSSSDLMFILNDILDISKIDEGEVKFTLRPMSICEVVDQVMRFWKPRAEEAGINLALTMKCDFKKLVHLDEYRFRQVLNNLVSNAIKYTERGSVLVTVERLEEGTVQIKIADTGVGIPAHQIEAVFSAYQQVNEGDKKGRKRKVGTGLGLPIARRLARLMGGDVELLSSGSAGSKFAFRFFAEEVELSEAERWDQEAIDRLLKGASALVVDDSMASAIVAREYLQKLGMRAEIAGAGKEAIDILRVQEFDLVLVDDNLGSMRGYEVIQQCPYVPRLGFIAYTGYVEEKARQNFVEQGYQGFLGKPAMLVDFKKEIHRLCIEGVH